MAMYVVNRYVRRKTNILSQELRQQFLLLRVDQQCTLCVRRRPCGGVRSEPCHGCARDLVARPGQRLHLAHLLVVLLRRLRASGRWDGKGEQGVGELGRLPRRSTHPRTPRAPRITHTRTSSTANCAAPKCPPDRCTSSRSSFFFSSRARTACATNTFSRAASCGASRPSSSSLTPTQGGVRTF